MAHAFMDSAMRYLINKSLMVFMAGLLSLNLYGNTENPDRDLPVLVLTVVVLGNYYSHIFYGFYSESDVSKAFLNIEPTLKIEVDSGLESSDSVEVTGTLPVDKGGLAEEPPWLYAFKNELRHSQCQTAYRQMVIDNLKNDEVSIVFITETTSPGGSGDDGGQGNDEKKKDKKKKRGVWDIYSLEIDSDSEDDGKERAKAMRLDGPNFILRARAAGCTNCNPMVGTYCPLHMPRPLPSDERAAFCETQALVNQDVRKIKREIQEARSQGQDASHLETALLYQYAVLAHLEKDETDRLKKESENKK